MVRFILKNLTHHQQSASQHLMNLMTSKAMTVHTTINLTIYYLFNNYELMNNASTI